MIDVFPEADTLPLFPSRDFKKTIAFYDKLGFGVELHVPGSDGYLILVSGPMELHFFPYPELDPTSSIVGVYIRSDDVDTLFDIVSPEFLPSEGIPRFEPPADRPWGMREFYVVDEDGSLLKFGQQIKKV
ncbi:VOC family protein [Parvibaculaceae bacterium PLY_AMNH_Bact1]|nr:VOC family protein [Parvibaculaceae bacterium PLY_AMNH_Bact1]